MQPLSGQIKGIDAKFADRYSVAITYSEKGVRREFHVPVQASGSFTAQVPDKAQLDGPVRFRVLAPNGIASGTGEAAALDKPVALSAEPWKPLALTAPTAPASPEKLSGIVLDSIDMHRLAGVPVLLWAKAEKSERPAVVVLAAETDSAGRFAGPMPAGPFAEVYAQIAGAKSTVPVPLNSDGSLPAEIVLVAEAAKSDDKEHCACEGTPLPRTPDTTDLLASESFAADKGTGCASVAIPNRTLEEYQYTVIVRTSQPDIQGLKLTATRLPLGGESSEPDRAAVNAANALDWDDEPLFYQATTIAHGHLLRFKQTWRADGYSLGDLLYSLPLAPGQKKQIAIVDWERREAGERTEALDATERVVSNLQHDRDIQEIVHSTLTEELQGTSASFAFGRSKGAGFSGRTAEGADFVLGSAGGMGIGASAATQTGSREIAANSLQRLRDRVSQSAAAVRSQRASIVQTVSQSESVTARTEVVANYNHCHALTIEYFEVLRHFRVDHELASVQEALFVPLLLSAFSETKALRWRELIEKSLRDPRLAPAFDAIERRRDNYAGHTSAGAAHAEDRMRLIKGELSLRLHAARPSDKEDGKFSESAWTDLAPMLDGLGVPSQLFERLFAGRPAVDRDRLWEQEILPHLASEAASRLSIEFVDGGKRTAAPIRVTVSGDGKQLRVRLQSKSAPAMPARADVTALAFSLTSPLPAGVRLLLMSGEIRYRTASSDGVLWSDDSLRVPLNGAVVDTPLSDDELRSLKQEDAERVARLLNHLNEHLEFYHRVIWTRMDAARRFMLLDGAVAPGSGGRSVASVVENRVIAVVGNSLVMPVAPGIRLDPAVSQGDLLQLYGPASIAPSRISLPTRGVFAEAILGNCNSCEKKDETRFWRWEESPIPDQPTAINPVSTDSRQSPSPDLTPKDFPAPIVNIQSAPSAPDPTGLAGALQLLGQGDLFRDVTGLAGNQQNALAALTSTLDAAKAFGDKAAELALQQRAARDIDKTLETIDKAKRAGQIDEATAKKLTEQALSRLAGGAQEPQGLTPAQAAQLVNTTKTLGEGGRLTFDKDKFDASVGKPGSVSGAIPSGTELVLAAFNPPIDRVFDPAGHSLAAKLSLRSGFSLTKWSCLAGPDGVSEMGQRLRFDGGATGETVKIFGSKPGLTAAVLDMGGEIAMLEASVPQFVRIRDLPEEFTTALDSYGLVAKEGDHNKFLERFEHWLKQLTKDINVRFVFQVSGYRTDVMPAHLVGLNPPENNFIDMRLANFDPKATGGRLVNGGTINEFDADGDPSDYKSELAGAMDHEYVEIYLQCLATNFNTLPLASLGRFADLLKAKDSGAFANKPVMIEFLGRYFACVALHELCHCFAEEPEVKFELEPNKGINAHNAIDLFDEGTKYIDVFNGSLHDNFDLQARMFSGFLNYNVANDPALDDPLGWGDVGEPRARITRANLERIQRYIPTVLPPRGQFVRIRELSAANWLEHKRKFGIKTP